MDYKNSLTTRCLMGVILGSSNQKTLIICPCYILVNYPTLKLIHMTKHQPIATGESHNFCHNPSLGLVTKAKAWKGVNQKCNLGVKFTLLGMQKSVRE